MSTLLSEPAHAPAAAPRAAPEWFIVMNQGSGSAGKEEVRKTIEAELRAAGQRHRFVPIPPGEIVAACQEAARLAHEHDGILVAAGGDGTTNCAAQAALGQDCALGLIPQ